MTIVEFLEARLDEIEAMADAASEQVRWSNERQEVYDYGEVPRWRYEARPHTPGFGTVWNGVGQAAASSTNHYQGQLMAQFDPAFVLRDISSKRAIVAACWSISELTRELFSGPDGGTGLASTVLRSLAAPFSDHPDYQAEWAVA